MLLLLLLAWFEEDALIEALLSGDDAAFATLLDRYHSRLVRLAAVIVSDPAAAEELAQETWLAMINGLRAFERRSSLKTWLFQILVNKARKRAKRDAREINWSAMSEQAQQTLLDPLSDRFNTRGGWSSPPSSWSVDPEHHLEYQRLLGVVQETIDALPEAQRLVITMRDLEGLSPAEVCDALDVRDNHQRVLLHRARTAVRAAVEHALRSE